MFPPEDRDGDRTGHSKVILFVLCGHIGFYSYCSFSSIFRFNQLKLDSLNEKKNHFRESYSTCIILKLR